MGDGSGRKILWVVLGTTVGFFLLCVLPCGGLVLFGSRMFGELNVARVTGEAFMENLRKQNIDDAYALTAPEFRARVTSKELRRTVDRYPAFTTQTNRSMGGLRILQKPAGPQAIIQYHLSAPNNTLTVTLILVKVQDQWRVESMNIP